MALTYSQWLAAKGLKSSEANAKAWQASPHYSPPGSPSRNREAFNTGPRAPQGSRPGPTPAQQEAARNGAPPPGSAADPGPAAGGGGPAQTPYVRPAFVSGVLDADGVKAIQNRTGQRDLRYAALDENKATSHARINQNRLGAEFQRDKGFRNIDAGHAARGTLRSGLREVDRGEVAADFARISNALDTDAKDVDNRWKQDRDMEDAQWKTDTQNLTQENEDRRWRKYLEQFGAQ